MAFLKTISEKLRGTSLRPGAGAIQRNLILAIGAIVAIALGLSAVALVARAEGSERIRLGNTGGSLTALVEVRSSRILVGAGPSRSHSADFVGRSTRPWDRDIDLLIIPGWDDQHATGALGLINRHDIHGIAVIDVPGEAPIWSLLERAARAQTIPVRYVESAHVLNLGEETTLQITPPANDLPGAWVRLQHRGFRVDMIDADSVENLSPPPVAFDRRNDHILINLRSQGVPEGLQPRLYLQPRPFWDNEFRDVADQHLIELDRNEHTELRFDSDKIRVPLADLSP